MNRNLHGKLWANYPRIFVLRSKSPMHSNMCFGCECGDGWYGVIDRLCWGLRALYKLLRVDTRATQVKEKFGGLRFYCYPTVPRWMFWRLPRWAGDLVYWLIDRAEDASFKTCEECGKPGALMHRGYWYATFCDACAPDGYERVRTKGE